MKLKMSQLVEKTGVPKSTILYYIKEGLLPEPERLKPNVCLYDESYVEQIKFIKFLQSAHGRTIAELKTMSCQGDYDFSAGSSALIGCLERLSGTDADSKHWSKDAFIAENALDETFVDILLEKGLLVRLSDETFDEKDLELVHSYEALLMHGWSMSFLEAYLQKSRELAELGIREVIRVKELHRHQGSMSNDVQHLAFEIPLKLEPYLINRSGIAAYKKFKLEPIKAI